jgi:phage N-6-adenine-methyltransferase
VTALAVHFSSATDEWATPPAFFERLAEEFGGFDLDPCCLPASAKAPRYYTPEDDGLAQPWEGRVWLNPPYGRTIGAWTSRARESVAKREASVVVGLLPARTDTAWWHRDVMGSAEEVRLVRGRLRFGDAVAGAPFPSVVVVWRPEAPALPRLTVMGASAS